MDQAGWEQRYRTQSAIGPPAPLIEKIAGVLTPGRALDLACGSGRNALWLAEQGWQVTAVDWSPAAIAQIAARNANVDARVADLEKQEYAIQPDAWDLIVMYCYLQRDLFEQAKRGVKPGGVIIAVVHIPGPGELLTPFRLNPGELREYFQDFEILHSYEGPPRDPEHARWVAEIAARRVVS